MKPCSKIYLAAQVVAHDYRENLVCYILAQNNPANSGEGQGVNGWEDGEWGGGPAGATVPYDVRGLHAAQDAIWAAPRGDRSSKLKN